MDNKVKEVFVFSDWSSLNQIKNEDDPSRKASATAIFSSISNGGVDVKVISGYSVRVTSDQVILFCVEIGGDGWCISEGDVVRILNAYGFSCEYKRPPYKLKTYQREELESLHNLGYDYVVRVVTGEGLSDVIAQRDQVENDSNKVISFRNNITTSNGPFNYIYCDWSFLPLGRPESIEKLLSLTTDYASKEDPQ